MKDRQIGRRRFTLRFASLQTPVTGSASWDTLAHVGCTSGIISSQILVKAWCPTASAPESISEEIEFFPGLFLEVRMQGNETLYRIFTMSEFSVAKFWYSRLGGKMHTSHFFHLFVYVLCFIIPTFRHSSPTTGEDRRVVSDGSETTATIICTDVITWTQTSGTMGHVLFHIGCQRIRSACSKQQTV